MDEMKWESLIRDMCADFKIALPEHPTAVLFTLQRWMAERNAEIKSLRRSLAGRTMFIDGGDSNDDLNLNLIVNGFRRSYRTHPRLLTYGEVVMNALRRDRLDDQPLERWMATTPEGARLNFEERVPGNEGDTVEINISLKPGVGA